MHRRHTTKKKGAAFVDGSLPFFLPQARELVKNVPLDPPPARDVPRELFEPFSPAPPIHSPPPRELFEMRVLYYF